ncbi:hypothetical protein NQ314_016368 [Rhamnusium bicolor]|uniref:Uncharacterized protein n=1 Tax=Rhamnusium bicolor TaxID=1586634 RepID=A0AAV8WYT9_9CUCU|nr:hypothetical protein NQ314_016368 [Rhamnusium bicolor]
MISSSLFVVIILMCEYGNSTRILGLVPTPSYSHQAVFRPIWRELAKRGHDLVVITTDPENDPKLNIREIDISYAYDLWKKYDIVKQFTELRSNPMKINIVLNALQDICIQELLHPDIQALLKNDTEYFDLIIMEYMYPIMFGFPGRFKSPYIGVVTMDLTSFVHSMLGNPTHPVLYPDAILPYEGKLSFWERLTSSLFSIFYPVFSIISGAMDTGGNQQIMEDHFGIDLPPVINILKNVSMVFINVDPSSYTRPLGPAFVAIGGGTHLRARKALPKV